MICGVERLTLGADRCDELTLDRLTDERGVEMLGAERTALLVLVRERLSEKLGNENPDPDELRLGVLALGVDVVALGADAVDWLGVDRCDIGAVRRESCACKGAAQTRSPAKAIAPAH